MKAANQLSLVVKYPYSKFRLLSTIENEQSIDSRDQTAGW